MLVDSHCHLNTIDSVLGKEILTRAEEQQSVFIDSSIDLQTTQQSLTLSSRSPCVFSAIGFHPFSLKTYTPEVITKYEQFIQQYPRIIAIGEIGLDYMAEDSLEKQEKVLREFIVLAQRNNLPIMLHNRLDSDRMLTILDDYYTCYEQVVFHCFSYGPEFLERLIAKGAIVSFSLNILRKKAEIREALYQCPLENLILETDSPYMRIKNKNSSPLDIVRVYEQAAYIKEISLDVLKHHVWSNIQRTFSL